MGFAKTLWTAQLLCTCYLVACATGDCGGEESCSTEEDASSLLQGIIQVPRAPMEIDGEGQLDAGANTPLTKANPDDTYVLFSSGTCQSNGCRTPANKRECHGAIGKSANWIKGKKNRASRNTKYNRCDFKAKSNQITWRPRASGDCGAKYPCMCLCEAPASATAPPPPCDTLAASSCPSDRCKLSGGCKDKDCKDLLDRALCEASPKVCGWTDASNLAPGGATACVSSYRIIEIGGTTQTFLHGTGVARKQYRTAFQKGTATGDTWKGCDGITNCWGGETTFGKFPSSYIKGGLSSSEYSFAAVELFIDCKIATRLNMQRRKDWETNVNLQAWYKDIKFQAITGADFSGLTVPDNQRNAKVPVTEDDDPPLLRVEASRGTSSSQDAAFKMFVQIEFVAAAWDRCMGIKDRHSQCLTVFADIEEAPLRSDHPMQIKCLDGTDTSPTGCREWLLCLGNSVAKTSLLKVLMALAKLRTDGSLLAQDKPVAQTLVQSQRSTGNCKNPAATTTCMDPDNLDVEAYDCECLDWVETATGDEIKETACHDENFEVCCDWKETHCTGFTADPQLLQRSQSQENLTEKGSQEAASLDESLSGKRSCR